MSIFFLAEERNLPCVLHWHRDRRGEIDVGVDLGNIVGESIREGLVVRLELCISLGAMPAD